MRKISKSSKFHLFLLCFGLLFTGLTPAQNEPQGVKVPGGVLMPWRSFGIDGEVMVKLKPILENAHKQFAGRWLKNAKPLTGLAANPTQNQKLLSDTILTGDLALGALAEPLLLEPMLCTVADRYLVFVQIANLKLDTVVAMRHISLTRNPEQEELVLASLPGQIESVYQAAVTVLNNHDFGKPDNAMHVGLKLDKESTRVDMGSNFCLNNLLTEKLSQKYRIIRNVGGETLQNLRYLLRVDRQSLRRPNRMLAVHWMPQVKDFKQTPKLPIQFKLRGTFSESVFGKRIGKSFVSDYNLSVNANEQIALQVDDRVEKFLADESKALNLTDKPQVARVYGAWVYLDRGRAYGLKMNDRLVSEDGSTRGHVVGFYGPDLGLKSPRGYEISEGAIVYIRKGQRDTKLGQAYQFDPKNFPTKWPPSQ